MHSDEGQVITVQSTAFFGLGMILDISNENPSSRLWTKQMMLMIWKTTPFSNEVRVRYETIVEGVS